MRGIRTLLLWANLDASASQKGRYRLLQLHQRSISLCLYLTVMNDRLTGNTACKVLVSNGLDQYYCLQARRNMMVDTCHLPPCKKRCHLALNLRWRSALVNVILESFIFTSARSVLWLVVQDGCWAGWFRILLRCRYANETFIMVGATEVRNSPEVDNKQFYGIFSVVAESSSIETWR
jgi:hypothetical protein